MKYFLTHDELMQLKNSYLYRDFPFAYIFYREMKRKGKFERFSIDEFSNFFIKWDDNGNIEILLPDYSHLMIKLSEAKCYVIDSQSSLFKGFDIP